jgi:glycosyltransferase involved in cell wall biosynthesis
MRLLLATDHYPPFIGGAHLQTRLLARALADRGHEVSVATPWQSGIASREIDGSVSIHRLRQLRTLAARPRMAGVQQHQPPFADPLTTLAMRRLIRSFKPDLVHSHGWISYACAAALTGLGTPLVLSARDYGYGCAKRTLLIGGSVCSGPSPAKCGRCAAAHYGWWKGLVATAGVLGSRPLLRRRVSAVHSVSHYVRRTVERDLLEGAPESATSWVIPEGVPERNATTAVALELGRLPSTPFMLFVGALRREKGIVELLAAYRLLTNPPPLVLVGTQERDTPSEFPPGTVVVRDLSHPAVLCAWDRAIFGVFPSVLPEPMGTAVCEAVCCGRPVIGTTPGGHEDVIEHDVNGLLVPAGDVPALATAMQQLLDDEPLRMRLARGAAASAANYRLETVVSRFEHFYQHVLDHGEGSARSSNSDLP